MPTTRRRHSITETPPVQEALDALRRRQGSDRIDLAELVVLGAREKLLALGDTDAAGRRARRAVADMIRSGDIPGDLDRMLEARRAGWLPE